MSHATITLVVLSATVVLFVANRLPPEVVAIGAALTLYAAGVLSSGQVVAGFGDPAVAFIASLFVVSEGLDASGVTAWAGQKLIAHAGASPRRLLVLMLGLVAGASALITPNGSVAALLPVAVVMAMRVNRPPSTFLMPLAFRDGTRPGCRHAHPDLAGQLGVRARRERRDLLVPGLDELELVADLVKGTKQAVDPVTRVTVDTLDAPLREAVQDELCGVGMARSLRGCTRSLLVAYPVSLRPHTARARYVSARTIRATARTTGVRSLTLGSKPTDRRRTARL